jgi:hypothetical protein
MDCSNQRREDPVNDERQFRLFSRFSIAMLGLVSVVALKATSPAKRFTPNFEDPTLIAREVSKTIQTPSAMPEVEAAQEVERINAGDYSPKVIGRSDNF